MHSLDFVAIDFETANNRSDSACQLALVVVAQGEIVEEKCWLIKPRRNYFSPQCIAVHGILPEHVKDQPTWDKICEDVWQTLEGRIVVAHNAGFDIRVLASTSQSYELVCPNLEYTCTRLIARRTWPGRTGYGLKPTATALGFSFKHHDALEDARVCAKIALASATHCKARSMDELEQKLSITRGRYRFGTMIGPRCIKRSKKSYEEEPQGPRNFRRDGWPEAKTRSPNVRTRERLASIDALVAQQGPNQPLQGRSVVLTGSLLGLERPDAIAFLERLGAKVQAQINLQTDFLIMGHADTAQPPSPLPLHPRQADAEDRREQGQPIRILSQRQLLALIPGGLASARSLADGSF